MLNKLFFITGLFLLFGTLSRAQTNVELLGQIAPSNIGFSDVWGYTAPDGREYALLGAYEGTYIIDLFDTANPEVVSFIAGPQSIWRDIKVHDKYAYVVTESGGAGEGLQIIDLSGLPLSASLVNTVNAYFSTAHDIFIDNGFAYVVGTNYGGMHILDLANPTNPIQTAYYSESGSIHDVYVWNDTVVVASENEYGLVDVTDKSNPFKISESESLPGYAHSGWMTEDKRYFFGTDEFNIRDITVFDLQDRNNWDVKIYSWQHSDNTIIHNLFIKGNYAHISYYESGYVVLDITDPLNPFVIGEYDTYPSGNNPNYNGAWGCFPFFDSGITLISDIETGLYILKFTPGDIPPSIFVNNLEEYVLNTDPVTLTASVADNGNVAAFNFFYRTTLNGVVSEWRMIEADATNGEEFDFIIPGQPATTKVEFYFAALDDSGNVSTLPQGGGGDSPAGIIPPPNFFSYSVIITGPPVILSLFPNTADTTVTKGSRLNFRADAVDTTGLELQYKWYSNDQFRQAGKEYTHTTAFGNVPRTDVVKLTVSNGFFEIENVWNVSVEEPLSVNDEENILSFRLEQSYPNPFSKTDNGSSGATIRYSIPSSVFVTLKVYDMLGREVARLINRIIQAGTHQVNFNAGELPSGVYLYTLQAGKFKDSKKMILVR